MDSDLMQKFESWKAAKEIKDYATADAIRSELRAAGFDPDAQKSNSKVPKDGSIAMQLQAWQDAKSSKDYATADAIREELRAQGIEPDPSKSGKSTESFASSMSKYLPPNWNPPFMQAATPMTPMVSTPMFPKRSMRPYDPEVEAELDQWVDLRSQKDYATADAMRESLRSRGISPGKERPGGPQDELEQWRRARDAKDFERSDRIRAKLRVNGIEPEKVVGTPVANPGPVPMSKGSSKGSPSLSKMDSTTANELRQWYDAKDSKDFQTADKIRSHLRSKGIEPADCPRPGGAPGMEAELEQWFAAKDEKNYAVADAIRERLRAQGIEPSSCVRPGPSGGASYGKASWQAPKMEKAAPYSSKATLDEFDSWTESKLDQWLKFKQDKNYGAADAIRAEMRALGIEPDQHRPKR